PPHGRGSLDPQHRCPRRVVGIAWRRRTSEIRNRRPGQDAEHYNYFRDYDPGIGRYLQSDPIGLGGGTNTFSYASATPLNHFDPSGQFDATGPLGRALMRGSATAMASGGGANTAGDAVAIAIALGSLGYDVYKACEKREDCQRIYAEIRIRLEIVIETYFSMLRDDNQLYTRAFSKRFSKRKGTYLGHRKEFDDAQRGLRDKIAEAEAMGCPVDKETQAWALIKPPLEPAGNTEAPDNKGK